MNTILLTVALATNSVPSVTVTATNLDPTHYYLVLESTNLAATNALDWRAAYSIGPGGTSARFTQPATNPCEFYRLEDFGKQL